MVFDGGLLQDFLDIYAGASEEELYYKINALDKSEGDYIIYQVNSHMSSDIINDIKTKTPGELLQEGWQDVTDQRKSENTTSHDYYNPDTGITISYDQGKEGASGF